MENYTKTYFSKKDISLRTVQQNQLWYYIVTYFSGKEIRIIRQIEEFAACRKLTSAS